MSVLLAGSAAVRPVLCGVMRSNLPILVLVSLPLLVAVWGCGPTETDGVSGTPAAASSTGESNDGPVTASSGDLTAAPDEAAVGIPEDRVEPVRPPLPEAVPPIRAASSMDVGRPGGTVVAGGLTIEVSEGTITDVETIEAAVVVDPGELGRPLPTGLILGAYRTGPWNLDTRRAIRVTTPLAWDLEPGLRVELLAWQPSMRAFIVAGDGRVDDTGRSATFSSRQLGDLIVRARPVQADESVANCPQDIMRLHESWPGPTEDEVVGLTPIEARIPREAAFNQLTDFRLAPHVHRVEFKNEEVVDNPSTRRDELATVDEDFLMDPNLSAAVLALGWFVEHEWVDPLSGEPAYRLRLTEAYDSLIEHSRHSTHYQGRAADITLSPVPAANGDVRREIYGRLSALSVCSGFDYVLFENQFHIHASVAASEVALVVHGDDGAYDIALARFDGGLRTVESGIGWDAAEVELADFRYDAPGRFSVVGQRPGRGEERFVLTRAGLVDAPRSAIENAALPRPSHDASISPDGLRRVVVRNGRAWVTYTSPVPPPGSVNRDGVPLHLEYPLPLSAPTSRVVDAAFRDHPRTRQALERIRALEATR